MRRHILSVAFITGVFLSCSAVARLGETAIEAGKRYGIHNGGTTTRKYQKNGMQIEATFFTNSLRKVIIGKIAYYNGSLYQGQVIDNKLRDALLEANADGKQWKRATYEGKTDSVLIPSSDSAYEYFRRDGARAEKLSDKFIFYLEDFLTATEAMTKKPVSSDKRTKGL